MTLRLSPGHEDDNAQRIGCRLDLETDDIPWMNLVLISVGI